MTDIPWQQQSVLIDTCYVRRQDPSNPITPPVPQVGWSSFIGTDGKQHGVVADGVTDNTATLNLLPPNVPIYGDTGTGVVRFNGQWIWQSGLNLILQNCPMLSYRNVAGNANASIIQPSLRAPLTNVFVDGLNVGKPDLTYLGLMILVYINGFTLTNWTINNPHGAIFIAGSDQEIAFGKVTNSATPTGNAGIRHFGNVPKVMTTGGKPANVYIHDNNIQSGDACVQIAQTASSTSPLSNISADDYLFSNNTTKSFGAEDVLIAMIDRGDVNYTSSTTNVLVQDHTGTSSLGVNIANESNPTGIISGITITDSTFDASSDTTGTPTIIVTGFDVSQVLNVTLTNLTISSSFLRSISVQGVNVSGINLSNSVYGAPRTGTVSNVIVRQTTGTVIEGCVIDCGNGDGIQVGPPTFEVSQTTINGNVINGVTNGNFGVLLQNCDSCLVIGNTITNNGSTTGVGIEFLRTGANPGTTNTKANGNQVTMFSSTEAIVYASGQGNQAINNPPAPDHTS